MGGDFQTKFNTAHHHVMDRKPQYTLHFHMIFMFLILKSLLGGHVSRQHKISVLLACCRQHLHGAGNDNQ